RLAEAGLLSEEREETGRRRRTYKLTAAGREALARWREEPGGDLYELRDVGTLKLFFGADPASLAAPQLAAHRGRPEEHEGFHEQVCGEGGPEGWRLALEVGIGHEREWVRFWSALLPDGAAERS